MNDDVVDQMQLARPKRLTKSLEEVLEILKRDTLKFLERPLTREGRLDALKLWHLLTIQLSDSLGRGLDGEAMLVMMLVGQLVQKLRLRPSVEPLMRLGLKYRASAKIAAAEKAERSEAVAERVRQWLEARQVNHPEEDDLEAPESGAVQTQRQRRETRARRSSAVKRQAPQGTRKEKLGESSVRHNLPRFAP